MSGFGDKRQPRDNTGKQKDAGKQQDTGQTSSSSGRDHGRRLVAMMKMNAEIDNKKLYEEILGGDYSKREKKGDRFKEIDTRLQAATSYIETNVDRIEDTEYFRYLVSRYKENKEGAFKDKSKLPQYTFERTCRDFTKSLEAIVAGLKDPRGVVPETPNDIVATHNILKHSESSLNDKKKTGRIY